MSRPLFLLPSLVVSLTLAFQALAWGQAAKSSPASLRDSGAQPWIVVKTSLQDPTGKNDKNVADFATQAQAQACAVKLNKEEKEPAKWIHAYRTRPAGDNSIVGKTFHGKVDRYRVAIHFSADRTFTVSGEMEGQGHWSQTGANLVMETPLAKYRGQIEEDKISGQRMVKDGSEPILAWSVIPGSDPRAVPLGRWVDETQAGMSVNRVTLLLRPDHTGMWLHDFDFMTADGGMVKSRLLRTEFRWSVDKQPDSTDPREGILLEHTAGDRAWGTRWIELNGNDLGGVWKRAGQMPLTSL